MITDYAERNHVIFSKHAFNMCSQRTEVFCILWINQLSGKLKSPRINISAHNYKTVSMNKHSIISNHLAIHSSLSITPLLASRQRETGNEGRRDRGAWHAQRPADGIKERTECAPTICLSGPPFKVIFYSTELLLFLIMQKKMMMMHWE